MPKSPARTYTHRDYDYEPQFARIVAAGQDLEMAYVETGPAQADPVVMLHGNPTWGFLYRHSMPALADRSRVVVPDLIGFGRSDGFESPEHYTLENHVEAFSRFMDALELTRVTLVVHDWGGPIGLSWAVDHPDRVARLVAMNTWAFTPEAHNRVPQPLATFRKRPHGEWLVLRANLFVNGALPLGVVQRGRFFREAWRAYQAPFPTVKSRVPVLAFPRDIPLAPSDRAYARMAATDAGLRSLGQPAMLIWGARDPVFPPRVMRKFEERLNVVRKLVYRDASHFLQEDRGADIGQAIDEFVQATR